MSDNKPKVSVLVLTYRQERYIRACLSSLALIQYPNFEIIVLDDGSPDDTAKVAEAFAEKTNVPIRVIRQQNTGQTSANAQKLIDISDGPYFLLIAGDDMLGPDYPIDAAVSRLESDGNIGLMLPRLIHLDDDTAQVTPHLYNPGFLAQLRSGSPDRVIELHLHRQISRIFLQGMVIRRSLVDSTGGFDTNLLADDYAFVFRIFNELQRQGLRFWFNENAFWIYRTHAGNIHKKTVRQMTLIMEVVAKYVPKERWSDFDLSLAAVDSLEVFQEMQSQALTLLGPAFGTKLAERLGRLSARKARDDRNLVLLREFYETPGLPASIKSRSRRYLWKIRLNQFRSWVSHDIPYSLADSGVWPARAIMRKRGFKFCTLSPIPNGSSARYKLADACTQTTVAPNFETRQHTPETSQFSEINAYVMENVLASPETSQVIQNGELLTTSYQIRQRNRIPSNCPMLGFYDKKDAVLMPAKSERHEKAILIGGDGAANWYHFVIEIVSKAYLVNLLPDTFRDYPVIVPECVFSDGPFGETLRILLPDRKLISLTEATAKVDNLILFDDVSLGPFNLYPGLWPKISDYSHHEVILNAAFSKLRQALVSKKPSDTYNRRIFLVRAEVRRSYNQLELLSVAKKYGFEAVSPEFMTLQKQAQMFSDASHVIGASGAAWTNMVFSKSPMKALTWIYAEYSEFCVYSSLSQMLGHDMRFVEAVPIQKINSSYDAHTASYNVPIEKFELALSRLCEGN